MSVPARRSGNGPEGQDVDRHSWQDPQANWDDAEDAAPPPATQQGRPWHMLSANWRDQHERHDNHEPRHHDAGDAAEVHEVRDGMGHEQQMLPPTTMPAPEDHRWPSHHETHAGDAAPPAAADAPQTAGDCQQTAGEHASESSTESTATAPEVHDDAGDQQPVEEHDGEHGGHDGPDHPNQESNSGPGHGPEAENNEGPSHDAHVAACDDHVGDDTPPAVPSSDAQSAAEDNHEPEDGQRHRDDAGGDAIEHNGRDDPDHNGTHARHGSDATWDDTFVWSDTSMWGNAGPGSHNGDVPAMGEEMEMDFDTGSSGEDNSGPPAHAHGSHDADELVCPAPAGDWHALL